MTHSEEQAEASGPDHRRAFVITVTRRLADWYAKFHNATLGDGDQEDPLTIVRDAIDSERDSCAKLVCRLCREGKHPRESDNEYHYEAASDPKAKILAGRCKAHAIWNG